jgi:rhamnosyltransferase
MVSLIIPTYRAENSIIRFLENLKEQAIDIEVIIIDSSSPDHTVEIAASYGADIVVINQQEFNHGGTRNLGVSHSHGDVIVFMTQDALLLDQSCIMNLIKPLETDFVAAAYGRQIPKEDAMLTERFARLYNYPDRPIIKGMEQIEEMGIKTFFFSNVFSAVRKKEFEELGGFPENVIMFEDMLFAAKLIERGYKIAYVPDAKVLHSHDYSLLQQLRRYYQAGVSFKMNPWFMDYAGSNKEGIKFLKEEIKFLLKRKEYLWIPYAMLEAMYKYVGYKLGLNYDRFPHFLNKTVVIQND